MNSKSLKTILFTVVAILTIPLIAMQFTDEVNRGIMDFVIAGILLFGTGVLIGLILRKVDRPIMRSIICALAIALLLLIWTKLAVGIFD